MTLMAIPKALSDSLPSDKAIIEKHPPTFQVVVTTPNVKNRTLKKIDYLFEAVKNCSGLALETPLNDPMAMANQEWVAGRQRDARQIENSASERVCTGWSKDEMRGI
jgi:hypothetical protein